MRTNSSVTIPPIDEPNRPETWGQLCENFMLSPDHDLSQCVDCGSGEACDGTLTVGPCADGYLCLAGVGPSLEPQLWQKKYSASAVQMGGPCPVGHFCSEGAKFPTSCQRGTSTEGEGGKAPVDCVPCRAGWYCSLNSSVSSLHVISSYLLKASSANISNVGRRYSMYTRHPLMDSCESDTAVWLVQEVLECPAGHYCPEGSVEPLVCPRGTYSLSPLATSSRSCMTCPPGYLCIPGTVDYSQWPCPTGYYCPDGSAVASPCAAGTFGVGSKATSAEDCKLCPTGK